MKTIELLKMLLDSGCTLVRHGANHDIWYSPTTGKRFPVPRHASKEVASGTLKDIVRKSGIELKSK
jgi:predicted RNA binding protein YcfA (HicA-like mRNA interferase family)